MPPQPHDNHYHPHNCDHKPSFWTQFTRRLDTLQTANIVDARTAGPFSKVKKLHNPKTYLVLAALAGFRYDWCFRNPYYWFAVGFCIKWYRARYVFKIPVWDRQPNWNNIITSKEQEKDLKAFTCKKCGSTLFIAKTREFFFEGDTGIGGLGCFSCGAKGKDNFVMDRDRIVEDVADMDDYFEYERPLDFVSRAERRALLKEAAGDEEKANELLMKRKQEEEGADGEGGPTNGDEASVVDAEVVENSDNSSSTKTEEPEASTEEVDTAATETKEEEEPNSTKEASPARVEENAENPSSVEAKKQEDQPAAPKKKKDKTKKTPPPPSAPLSDEDIFDALDMD
eukprot:scaffold945_cov170-Amphora_coffeaeformis.AAC.15